MATKSIAKKGSSSPRINFVKSARPAATVTVYNTVTKSVEVISRNSLTSNHKFL